MSHTHNNTRTSIPVRSVLRSRRSIHLVELFFFWESTPLFLIIRNKGWGFENGEKVEKAIRGNCERKSSGASLSFNTRLLSTTPKVRTRAQTYQDTISVRIQSASLGTFPDRRCTESGSGARRQKATRETRRRRRRRRSYGEVTFDWCVTRRSNQAIFSSNLYVPVCLMARIHARALFGRRVS